MLMADEERQELVSNLRNYMPPKRIHPAYGTALHIRAADEIERLAEELNKVKEELHLWKGPGSRTITEKNL
jgi:hypothetical protein